MPKVTNERIDKFCDYLEKRGTGHVMPLATGSHLGLGERVGLRDILEEWENYLETTDMKSGSTFYTDTELYT